MVGVALLAVALAGACPEGTPPFVPTFAFAAVENDDERNRGDGDGDGDGTSLTPESPASCVTVMVREGMGDAARLEEAAGRAYCWACGDATHRKATCPRRGNGDGDVGRGGDGNGDGNGNGNGNGDGNGNGNGDGTSPTPVPSPTPADHLAGMVEKTRLG